MFGAGSSTRPLRLISQLLAGTTLLAWSTAALTQEIDRPPPTAAAEPEPAPAETDADAPVAYSEIQDLIRDMQARLNKIDTLSKDADQALDTLDNQVDEAIDKLETRDEENTALRDRATGLSTELNALASTHDQLSATLAETEDDRQTLEERLQSEIDSLAEQLSLERAAITELEGNVTSLSTLLETTTGERDELDDQLVVASQSLTTKSEEASSLALELASVRSDIEALREVRTDLEGQVAALSLELESTRESLLDERKRSVALTETLGTRSDELLASRESVLQLNERLEQDRAALETEKSRNRDLVAQVGQLRDRSKVLEAELADEAERTVLAQKDIESRDVRIEELLTQVAAAAALAETESQAATVSRSQVTLLNRQLAELRNQLISLNSALEVSEERNLEQQAQIVNLGARLNQALATKVQELASYRSEFFGRLREVLGARGDVQIVGDRFVIQSEVLFETGSADLGEDGRGQLEDLASTLSTIAGSIPPGVDWILRVDGHTDERPIRTEQFPSNWELSAARALSVVNFLIERDIPPGRLVAAGFGQFHPLDPRQDEIAFRRNRRIEFKLTQR